MPLDTLVLLLLEWQGLTHVDGTEESGVNQIEICLGRPYNIRQLQQKEVLYFQPLKRTEPIQFLNLFSTSSGKNLSDS